MPRLLEILMNNSPAVMLRTLCVFAVLSLAVLAYKERSHFVRPSTLENVAGIQRTDIVVHGHRGFIFRASNSSKWVWYAPTLYKLGYPGKRHEWIFNHLLSRGISVAGIDVGESYGSPEGVALYQEFYEALTSQYGFAPKPCLLAQSRGGLMLYKWAEDHPEDVACIAGIYPLVNLKSWPPENSTMFADADLSYRLPMSDFRAQLAELSPLNHLAPLVKYRVPILSLHGSADSTVPASQNSVPLTRKYREIGGKADLIIVPNKGHDETDSFFESPSIPYFIEKSLSPSVSN
jgi:alpha-beta hydrolase superfamily lysophospholipase